MGDAKSLTIRGYTIDKTVKILLYKQNKLLDFGVVFFGSEKKALDRVLKKLGITEEKLQERKRDGICNIQIVTTANEGFKLSLNDAMGRHQLSQSFTNWSCKVTKEDENLEFITDIDPWALLRLFNTTTFTNGVCRSSVSFARLDGHGVIIRTNGNEYKQAFKDMILRREAKISTTRDWKEGYVYYTATQENIYLGKIHKLFDFNSLGYTSVNGGVIKYKAKIRNDTDILHLMSSVYDYRLKESTTMRKLYERWVETVNSLFDSACSSANEELSNPSNGRYLKSFPACDFLGKAVHNIEILGAYNATFKLPARKEGNCAIKMDMNPYEAYSRIINLIQVKFLRLIDIYEKYSDKFNSFDMYALSSLLVNTSFDNTVFTLNENEKKILIKAKQLYPHLDLSEVEIYLK